MDIALLRDILIIFGIISGFIFLLTALILLLIISICSCNTDISQLNTETVKWNDLPNEVQKAIIESSDSSFVNLDSKLFATEYKSTSIVGLYKGKKKFYLNNNE